MKSNDIVDLVAACFYLLMGIALGVFAIYAGPSEGWTPFSVVAYAIIFLMLAGVLFSSYAVIRLIFKDQRGKE